MRVEDLSDYKLLDLYIGDLKDVIQHQLRIQGITNIIKAINLVCHIEAKNIATHKFVIGCNTRGQHQYVPNTATTPQPNSITPKQM
jgi:hypothetical protein